MMPSNVVGSREEIFSGFDARRDSFSITPGRRFSWVVDLTDFTLL